MSPGELATVLALVRVRVEAGDCHPRAALDSFFHVNEDGGGDRAFRQAIHALDRQRYYDRDDSAGEHLAAIDRAILEAEALEDMGAVEVLP